jgi:hypothetical protein
MSLEFQSVEDGFDRGYGKPAQEVQITGDRTFNIVFDPILKEELGADC